MDLSKLFEKSEGAEFTTFPQTLDTYKAYKPILIAIIAAVITLLITAVPTRIIGKPDDPIIRIIYTSLTVIALIPSLYIATRIIYKIPFSTQIAPIRKWNWNNYIKSFIITLTVYLICVVAELLITKKPIVNKLTPVTFILCLILPLFQGFAEEYLCRGFLMQTFGSWLKIPLIAIIIQAAIFSVMHNYGILGLISVLSTGLCYGLLAWYGQGLEAPSAMHAMNNIVVFLLMGFGIQSGLDDGGGVLGLLGNIAMILIPIAILIILDKKYDWGLKGDVN